MKQVFFFLCILFCLSGCADFTQQVQAQTANAVAHGANSALPLLLDRYRQAGVQAINQASTREDAERELTRIKAKWEPVWEAWESLRVAQDSWARALEQGGDLQGVLGGLQRAYCGLRRVWPEEIQAMPLVPLTCGATP